MYILVYLYVCNVLQICVQIVLKYIFMGYNGNYIYAFFKYIFPYEYVCLHLLCSSIIHTISKWTAPLS